MELNKRNAVVTLLSLLGFISTFSAASAQTPSFLYSANGQSNDVSAYEINSSTGALTPVPGSPFLSGVIAHGVASDPSGRFLFVVNSLANTLSVFAISASTGSLAAVPGSPFAIGSGGHGVLVHPNGLFVYVENSNSNTISAFAINQTTGMLTPVSGSPFGGGGLSFSLFDIQIDPTGHFLYVPNDGPGTVSGFTINTGSGVLTPMAGSPFSTGTGANTGWVTLSPDGRFLYASETTIGTVAAFSVNSTSGSLTLIPGSPFSSYPNAGRCMAIDPQGRFLYVADSAYSNVTGFQRNITSGALTKISGSPFSLGGGVNPSGMTADPSGNFIYVGNDNTNNISVLRVDQTTGALANIPGSPFPSGQEPLFLAVVTPRASTTLGINSAQPASGGNSGSVTVQIIGSGFQSGASVTLTGVGPDILGVNTAVPNSSFITTTFDLTGATVGPRTVTVTNPETSLTLLPAGFTVQQGGAAQISVDIIGRDKIRIGTGQTYYASIHNKGSIDAPVVVGTFGTSGDVQQLTGKALSNFMSASSLASLNPISVGPVPSGGSLNIPISLRQSTGSCSTLQSVAYELKSDICSQLDALSDAADQYLNGLYAQKLSNTTMWLKAMTPKAKGGDGNCFDINDLKTRVLCVEYELADAALDGAINGLENAKQVICAAKTAAGCPGRCDIPKGFTDLLSFVSQVSDDYQKLVEFFNSPTPPQGAVLSLEDQIALLQTQALTFPTSLGFPSSPPTPLSVLPPSDSASLQICGVGSLDPNDKIGPTGVGSSRFVAPSLLSYAVYFENQPTATAPAQSVTVNDTLNPNLDLNTLTLGAITFPNQLITPPSVPLATMPFAATVDLRPATNLLVKINASLNTATGTLTWTFQSLDPTTGLPPTDPTAGFLPPGAEGSVFFTAMPKSTVTTGTGIQNMATVVFDANAPVNTPTWFNTIDNTAPMSRVAVLAPTQSSLSFSVQWSGTDVGAGVQDYTIYVSDNGGAFAAWMTNTTSTQSAYVGVAGHTYQFYSVARDLVGNVEGSKTAAEASTQIVISAIPQIVATRSVSRDAQSNVIVKLTLANTGGAAAQTTLITVAQIGSTSATSIPTTPMNIAAGSSTTVTLVFPPSVGAPNTNTTLTTGGTYVGGSFNFSSRITLP